MNKSELIEAIRKGRADIKAMWAGASDAQLTERPGPQSDWSIKDLMAHFIYWEQSAVEIIETSQRGETRLWDAEDDVTVNARVFEQNRDRSLPDIQADFRNSLVTLEEAIQSLSDDELSNPNLFSWQENKALWEFFAAETINHYPMHMDDLVAWRERIGLS